MLIDRIELFQRELNAFRRGVRGMGSRGSGLGRLGMGGMLEAGWRGGIVMKETS